MLYPKNQAPQLQEDLFRNPTEEYRATPFWAWNCQLEQEELLRQLEVLKQMGMGGAHMHVRTGMATPYLSDEHMDLIKACVEKCRREHMLAWLYDEDRWPSGAAGGIVTKDPQYRNRYLLLSPHPYASGVQGEGTLTSTALAKRTENGYLLACYDVQLDDQGCLSHYARIDPVQDAQGTKWYAYVETPDPSPWYNNQTYINTLDPAAMRRFIQVTYDRYLETVGEDFGGLVPAIFTDEPQFTTKSTLGFATDKKDICLPWTDDLPETFQAACGEDLLAGLPELLWELPNGQVSTIRYHYHDHTCERFAQAFADQCGAWCKEHGLMLTGHMMEEPTLNSQTHSLGEAMRSYRSFQLPGIDMLCDGIELTTAKQAQSAARQFGCPGVISELYGVTGWDFDFRGHKFQGDWQAALGVTVRVPHLSWVSMKGEAKRDYPASINYQSPWWQDYSYVEDHFARIATAMTRGKAEVKVGVIHPIESYWLHYGPQEQTAGVRDQLEQRFQNLTRWLLFGCIDFDFISESLLPIQCDRGSAPLEVGQMAYDVILVPGCETLRSSTLERLEAFASKGGKLIFLGEAPKYENARPSSRGAQLYEIAHCIEFSKAAVLDSLDLHRTVEIRGADGKLTENLLHQLRRDGDGLWLFIAHGEKPYHKDIPIRQEIRITLPGHWSAEIYDTITGKITPVHATVMGCKTVIATSLYDLDSLLLRLLPGEPVSLPKTAAKSLTQLTLPALVNYTLDEPNVYLLDKAEFALNDGPWHPEEELLRADNVLRRQLGYPLRGDNVAQPWVIREAKPEHIARLRFRVQCTCGIPNVKLALEDADFSTITVNGSTVSAKPDGWFTDRCIGTVAIGDLQAGENILEVALPFGRRSNIEWCYLLGDFGVQVLGHYRFLTAKQSQLGFDDVTKQGLAHYGGNITYHIPFTARGGHVTITAPHFAGTAVKVTLDGNSGYIAYPPYRLELGQVAPGDHVLQLQLLGHRGNCFGPVHLADPKYRWLGPDCWRTTGSHWTESYRLKTLGILSAPIFEEET